MFSFYDIHRKDLEEKYSDFHIDDLLILEGTSVKACYNTRESKFMEFGRVVKFRVGPIITGLPDRREISEEVVVISTQDTETLWLGTSGQYFRMWCVD